MLKRLLFLVLPLSTLLSAAEFKVEKGVFVLDGKPFQIRAGEIHYPRVPRAEWRNRIRMAKAMGLNTISTYVFWNYHEARRGEFDFSGEKDVMEFVKLCGAEGMKAILRPGPFVCAEWDLGGLPAWLLKEPGIKLRSSDGRFLEPAGNWMRHMGSMLKPLAVSRNGPVIMVQVENEFGNYGVADAGYLDAMQAALKGGGWDGLTFSADAPGITGGGRPGMLRAANFGSQAETMFVKQRKAFPGRISAPSSGWAGSMPGTVRADFLRRT
jgi:beta-galactosidase